ncbi:MAG: hypothetical protein HC925_01670 [Coleofasciculaceae cyanobacterium SM2_3_26]|nr:hypothetical protein [Coleofasciculaceae cyanobacterium SM2_3_26]
MPLVKIAPICNQRSRDFSACSRISRKDEVSAGFVGGGSPDASCSNRASTGE